MSRYESYDSKKLKQLRSQCAELGVELAVETDLSCLGESVRIGKAETPNRFAVHPMEGFDADAIGTPGPLSFRRYERYAAGGAGLIWCEATAVRHEGRSQRRAGPEA